MTMFFSSGCGANFISADAKKYACSSYVNGGASACSNKTRVRRDVLGDAALQEPGDGPEVASPEDDHVEAELLDEVLDGLRRIPRWLQEVGADAGVGQDPLGLDQLRRVHVAVVPGIDR